MHHLHFRNDAVLVGHSDTSGYLPGAIKRNCRAVFSGLFVAMFLLWVLSANGWYVAGQANPGGKAGFVRCIWQCYRQCSFDSCSLPLYV